jgi:RES domain-containing protein
MLYTAANPSLALLEILVHLDLPVDALPTDYRLLSIDVPDTAPIEDLGHLPPTDLECSVLGDDFLARGTALGFRVPSAVMPWDRNLLINPTHAAAASMTLLANEPFAFDPRLS